MAKEIKEKTSDKKYSKSAFVEAAENNKESIVLQVVLEDGKTYSKDEAATLVKAWKTKEVK